MAIISFRVRAVDDLKSATIDHLSLEIRLSHSRILHTISHFVTKCVHMYYLYFTNIEIIGKIEF